MSNRKPIQMECGELRTERERERKEWKVSVRREKSWPHCRWLEHLLVGSCLHRECFIRPFLFTIIRKMSSTVATKISQSSIHSNAIASRMKVVNRFCFLWTLVGCSSFSVSLFCVCMCVQFFDSFVSGQFCLASWEHVWFHATLH